MRQALKLHPDSRCDAVIGIEVEIVLGKGDENRIAELRYLVTGKIDDIRLIPEGKVSEFELWRHTCFEAFVRPPEYPAYIEFNFAPTGQEAEIRFLDYREGGLYLNLFFGTPKTTVTKNLFEIRCKPTVRRLDPTVAETLYAARGKSTARGSPDEPNKSIWRVGLSAVIEETNGRLSYWALKHPPGKPDFHHPDCFALELPPA